VKSRHMTMSRAALVPRPLLPLWKHWRLFILRWALREICPLHKDVPKIVQELHHWERA
jgi:hypothetical protein